MLRFSLTMCALVLFVATTPANGQPKAYWIWNSKAQEYALNAQTLYVFQGSFDVIHTRSRYRFQGVIPRRLSGSFSNFNLTYRLERLVPPAMVASRFIAHRHSWKRYGVQVAGIQIDYDCPTHSLLTYARWLAELKRALSVGVSISITGLGDWLTSARPGHLRKLTDQTESIAFMMYHNGRPIHPLENYTKRLEKLSAPFFLGRLPNQNPIAAFSKVRQAIGYRGDIVFLGLGTRTTTQ